MGKLTKILCMAFLLAVFVSLASFAGTASAYSNTGMSLSEERLQKCPGDTETLVLTLTNNDDVTHTYVLSLEMPQGWNIPDNGFIPHCADCPDPDKGITLASGQSKNVEFWINPPAVAPGTYGVKVNAKSGVDQASKNVEVEVLRCHDVKIDAPQNIDICADSEFQYTYSLTNNGKESEEFEVVATGSWGFGGTELRRESVKIDAGKKKDMSFSVVAPAEGGRVTVKASSKSSYAADEQYSQLNVKKCYDFQAAIDPKEPSSCMGTPSKFVLNIKNKGTAADTYAIQAPGWVTAGAENVTILPGQEKNVDVLASPARKGKNTFGILITSKGNAKLKTNVTASVDAQDCRSVSVTVAPADQEICRGPQAEFNVTVRNTGNVKDSYDLSSNIGVLASSKVSLAPGEAKVIGLKIDTEQLAAGEKQVNFTAKSGDVTGQDSALLNVKNCYAAEFGVSPQESAICGGDKIEFVLAVKNTGDSAQNYTLTFQGNGIASVSLAPNEMKMLSTAINFSYPEGNYSLKFGLNLPRVSMDAFSNVTVKPKGICYRVEISSEGPLTKVDPGKGIAIAARVKNVGEKPDSFTLALQGPAWVHLNQDSVSLKPGEQASVYLYASPGYDVAKTTYDAVINAKSANSDAQNYTFRIGVGVMPQAGPGVENATNASSTIPTGAITGLNGNAGKVILLALIVLVILVILVVKFVLFVK